MPAASGKNLGIGKVVAIPNFLPQTQCIMSYFFFISLYIWWNSENLSQRTFYQGQWVVRESEIASMNLESERAILQLVLSGNPDHWHFTITNYALYANKHRELFDFFALFPSKFRESMNYKKTRSRDLWVLEQFITISLSSWSYTPIGRDKTLFVKSEYVIPKYICVVIQYPIFLFVNPKLIRYFTV